MSVVRFHTFSVTIAVVLLNQELRPMSLHVYRNNGAADSVACTGAIWYHSHGSLNFLRKKSWAEPQVCELKVHASLKPSGIASDTGNKASTFMK